MDVGVEVDGLRDLQRALRSQPPEIRQQLRAVNKDAAQIVADTAKVLVPVRSGRLRATIKATAGQREASVKAGTATRVQYAGALHWGWASRPNKAKGWRGGPIRPQPFLYEALDRRIVEVRERYEQQIRRVVAAIDTD